MASSREEKQGPGPAYSKRSKLPLASLILSIFSFLFLALGCLCTLGMGSPYFVLIMMLLWLLAAIAGISCGRVALARIKRSSGILTGRGIAMSGVVIGYGALSMLVIGVLRIYSNSF